MADSRLLLALRKLLAIELTEMALYKFCIIIIIIIICNLHSNDIYCNDSNAAL